jgi:hypothetical protein
MSRGSDTRCRHDTDWKNGWYSLFSSASQSGGLAQCAHQSFMFSFLTRTGRLYGKYNGCGSERLKSSNVLNAILLTEVLMAAAERERTLLAADPVQSALLVLTGRR